MSSVMRPSGPLQARVYWLRRLLALAVIVVVVVLVWWLLSSRGTGSQSAGSPRQDVSLSGVGTTRASSAAPPQTKAGVTSSPPPSNQNTVHHRSRSPGSRSVGQRKQSLAPPSGTCVPTDVDITVRGSDAKVGQTTVATLSLTTIDGAVCRLQITPSSMVMRITSGTNVVWTSDDCPNLLPARQVVVRPEPATTYRWSWDGRRSVQGCVSPGAAATPGKYEVEAALVGADVHKGVFRITG